MLSSNSFKKVWMCVNFFESFTWEAAVKIGVTVVSIELSSNW